MTRRIAALTASLGVLFVLGGTALAQDSALNLPGAAALPRITVNYGNAKPPGGFLKFCERLPDACAPYADSDTELSLSTSQWQMLEQVNRGVNRRINSVSDQELYGQQEFWTYPSNAGDCEDYVLQKQRELVALGFPGSALLITVVLDERREGHAVLTVSTADGDFILDNRRDDILHWSSVNYSFLKRQTPADPASWVALAPQKNQATLVASGDDAP